MRGYGFERKKLQPISVILPTKNRPTLLAVTLASLADKMPVGSQLLIFDSSKAQMRELPEIRVLLDLLTEKKVEVVYVSKRAQFTERYRKKERKYGYS